MSKKHLSDNADLTDALREVQARYYSIGNDIARLEQSIEHHIERVEQLKLDLNETEEGWEQTREELDIDLRKITQLGAELSELEPRLESARQDEERAAEELSAEEAALQKWQQEWDEFNKRAEEPRQKAEVEQSRIQQLESIIERGLERKQRLEREKQELLAQPDDHNSDELAGEISRLEQSIAELKSHTANQTTQLGISAFRAGRMPGKHWIAPAANCRKPRASKRHCRLCNKQRSVKTMQA